MARARRLRMNRENGSQKEETTQNEQQDTECSLTIEHQNPGQTYEYTVQDSTGAKTHGKTVLADVWNLPKGHRIVVMPNKSNQPIGDERGILGHFCGTIARNGGLCSLSHTRWDYLKKGNKGNNQIMILNEVQVSLSSTSWKMDIEVNWT